MGILTNPNGEDNNKLVRIVKDHHGKLGFLCYLVSIVWIIFLANPNYNLRTYFSENALLPGLVVEHFDNAMSIQEYLTELQSKENLDEGLSPAVLESIFHRIGITETEIQNFTLFHPVLRQKSMESSGLTKGANVFGVLRAKRSSGTESLVLNTPYFRRNNISRRNIFGIAVMLGLAEYFKEQVYWAKDIVFLVADGHVGSLAWVKGHQEIRDNSDNLLAESVRTKAGNIQAAINFILEGSKTCSMETKFHGVNGQLPNLDLVNLINKFIAYHNKPDRNMNWEAEIWKLYSYMLTQASGSSTGSHGFFLKYGTESVTLIGKTGNCRPIHYGDIGRILEATFRSLNNLLEKLHQSFFFYLKASSSRFISIGLYFPPLALALFAIPLKASAIWLVVPNLESTVALFYLALVHFMAIGQRWLLSNLNLIPSTYLELTSSSFTYLILGMMTVQFISIQFLRILPQNVTSAIYCFVLLELGVCLYTFALFNPSLIFFLGYGIVPIVTLLFAFQPNLKRQKVYLGVLSLISLLLSYLLPIYLESVITPQFNKHFYESEVYGNFTFDFLFVIIFPLLSIIPTVI